LTHSSRRAEPAAAGGTGLKAGRPPLWWVRPGGQRPGSIFFGYFIPSRPDPPRGGTPDLRGIRIFFRDFSGNYRPPRRPVAAGAGGMPWPPVSLRPPAGPTWSQTPNVARAPAGAGPWWQAVGGAGAMGGRTRGPGRKKKGRKRF